MRYACHPRLVWSMNFFRYRCVLNSSHEDCYFGEHCETLHKLFEVCLEFFNESIVEALSSIFCVWAIRSSYEQKSNIADFELLAAKWSLVFHFHEMQRKIIEIFPWTFKWTPSIVTAPPNRSKPFCLSLTDLCRRESLTPLTADLAVSRPSKYELGSIFHSPVRFDLSRKWSEQNFSFLHNHSKT